MQQTWTQEREEKVTIAKQIRVAQLKQSQLELKFTFIIWIKFTKMGASKETKSE